MKVLEPFSCSRPDSHSPKIDGNRIAPVWARISCFWFDSGKGMLKILFVSSEMEEIIGMSDRAIVMHEGMLAGELMREQLTEESIMQLATGSLDS